MENNNIKPINFWKLISTYSIEIPIIQRDYAQGRVDEGVKKKRDKFLEALHSALITDGKQQTLDFVYGDEDNRVFQPLDGQQRLTTLFLLHWFVALKEGQLTQEVKNILSKFTYETRTSSREFCYELVKNELQFENTESISTVIKTKSNWWVLGWEKDPTISAMLNMLDAIQDKFTESNLWDKLISDKIVFVNIPIKDFGLSDDLYVKMNARGKHLTDFENWKAEFERHISIGEWENNKNIMDSFAHKMDTTWTDLFWKYRDENNRIDDNIRRFIKNIQILSVTKHLETKDFKGYNQDTLPFHEASKYKQDDYNFLYDVMTIWSSSDKNNLSSYDCIWFDDDKTRKNNFNIENYNQRVFFYAEYIALKNNIKLDSEVGKDWMRVVRNIVWNSSQRKIDSLESQKGAIALIDELSQGCGSIYEWLSNNTVTSGFAKDQVEEEINKAKLICHNSEWREIIFKCEDSSFCEGRIAFLLKCVDFTDTEGFDFDKFKKVANVVLKYFAKFSDLTIKHKLWRAFLTVSDSKFYSCWASWSYLMDCRKRWMPNNINNLRSYCYNHFEGNRGSEHYAIELVKALLDTDIDSYIETYNCPSDMSIWKQRLIKEENLFKFCTEGYLCVSDDDCVCWLIEGVRPSSKDKYKEIN